MMEFLDKYFKYDDGLKISGLTKELNIFYILKLFEKRNEDILVLTSSLYEATKIYNQLQTYTDKILLFPMDDFFTSVSIAESPELKYTRLETLKTLKTGNNIIITNLMGYLKFLPSVLEKKELILSKGELVKRIKLLETLDNYGYIREALSSSTGEYALRGMIIDIFPIHENKPIRIEFDGDEIVSIKYYDENTQLTVNEINTIIINPVNEIKTNNHDSILEYMNNKNVVYYDYAQLRASYNKLLEDIFYYQQNNNKNEKLMFDLESLEPSFKIYINTIENKEDDLVFFNKEIINYNEDFNKLVIDYNDYIKNNYQVYFYLANDYQKRKIKEILPNANIVKKKINNGFILEKIVVIADEDIENTKRIKTEYKSKFKFGKKIKNYNQLEIGDYVVHVNHGIGIYNGIVKLKKNNVAKDFIQILYAGNDKIYVPVEKINIIYKYSDKDGASPKINRLNSDNWNKTKRFVEKKVQDISRELIMLYQERLAITSPVYKNFAEEEIFGNSFQYNLTRDQKKSIDDIIIDLNKNYPMDRLLCGDVGFGKTEVAFRSMFNTVLNNYQVMYLCPTTILSNQQYKLALERFKDWPIEIGLLNRFISVKTSKEIIKNFKEGKIDILFGTHRILSNDITPKNLGLLIVDEEQRFGVTHKEKIKQLKNDVNVLTLSATPIPRTLKMALSGLRDLSVIDTPPVNRYPIQTYVISENELIIKDAIYKELSRDGQIFILYNKIEDIDKKTDYIKKLVPDAKINYAHGQMNKNDLENIMNDFINYKFDILVCTTIIENGIDIPNVNTLLVYDADKFGLSQLYQIRGRVGRSNKIGYAYLLYNENKILNETAVKRLQAIKDFTELGSGYKIAMRDLAIRGAGDIFGSSQAGFIDSVGINLYLKMMENELKKQKGEYITSEEEDFSSLINIATHISDDYVKEDEIKIEIHQMINKVNSKTTFDKVQKELEDRFGKINDTIKNYMYEEWFESLSKKLKITQVHHTERSIEIIISKEISNQIKGDKLLMNAFQINSKFNIKYVNGQIIIVLYFKNLEEHFIKYLVTLLETIELEMHN